MPVRVLLSVVVFAGLWSLTGCTSSQPSAGSHEGGSVRERLKTLGIAYNRIGKGAKDEATFRTALAAADKSMLERFHIHSIDDLFVSPRDQQPFVIKYGTPPGTPGMAQDLLAYEQAGVGCKRYVLFSTTDVEEVDESRFKQLEPEASAGS